MDRYRRETIKRIYKWVLGRKSNWSRCVGKQNRQTNNGHNSIIGSQEIGILPKRQPSSKIGRDAMKMNMQIKEELLEVVSYACND